jgi:hypothetical protein
MKTLHLGIIAATIGLLGVTPVSANATYRAGNPPTRTVRTRQAHDDKSLTDRIDARFKADASLKKLTVGEKTKQSVSKTGEVIDDAYITTKVHSRFVGEDALKDSHIDVDTNNHVVTLKGTVKSAAGRARAVAIAKTTDGVTRVVDDLKIQ